MQPNLPNAALIPIPCECEFFTAAECKSRNYAILQKIHQEAKQQRKEEMQLQLVYEEDF